MESENRKLIERLEKKVDTIDQKVDRLNDALLGDDMNVREGFIPRTNRRIENLEDKVTVLDKIESLERDLKESQDQLASTKENFEAFIKEHNRYQMKIMLKMLGAAGAGGGVVGGIATALGGWKSHN